VISITDAGDPRKHMHTLIGTGGSQGTVGVSLAMSLQLPQYRYLGISRRCGKLGWSLTVGRGSVSTISSPKACAKIPSLAGYRNWSECTCGSKELFAQLRVLSQQRRDYVA
jgi:hypothetical protein